ncbi:hypothetical protein FG465_004259 [Yersinia enterocolitica]|uniref:hypothetical protein n=1 Tax=Yersinia enterocolitica TaxID=630 RepID=UPI0029A47C29|nr:hypothetical protein [Yersinia enterocolitica]HEI6777223.1 hypothetical protein [Yersinia enterocolitica]HEI6781480.1 hypothetical protein [Yersinia enterocolitica]HEI6785753.1 hypothetical protein [Yersinia enterocolitica]HEI6878567.1 hypothetical protein [Yersinia enterocolitica]
MLRSMKRYAGAGILFLGVVLLPVVQAATSGTAQIQVTLLNKQPTCALSFNNGFNSFTYNLGSLSQGEVRHTSFTVNIACEGNTPVKTAVTAKNMSGTLQGGDTLIMRTGYTGPLLWLEVGGMQKVKLSGLDRDAFCVKANTSLSTPNICTLVPVTKVSASDTPGNVSATIRFEVVYPA